MSTRRTVVALDDHRTAIKRGPFVYVGDMSFKATKIPKGKWHKDWASRRRHLHNFEKFALKIMTCDDKAAEQHFLKLGATQEEQITKAATALEGCRQWSVIFAEQADLAEVVCLRMHIIYERLYGREFMEAHFAWLETARYGDEKIHEG
jgi:hypothetical protein